MSDNVPHAASLKKNLAIVWSNRRPILLFSVAAAGITLLVNLFLPRYYKSTATLLPETESSKLSAFTQFADIAQMTGLVPGTGEVSRLYPDILKSESVLLEVIQRHYQTGKFAEPVDLVSYFEIEEDTPVENADIAIETLRDLIGTSFESKTGLVSASVEMPEPQLAADVLNAMIDELDAFMRVKRITSASEQLRWITVRLGEVDEELKVAEDSLKLFRERNRRVGDSPSLLLQQQRLIREVEISSATFVELKKQYEVARIEEIKNISLVNVLDAARPPIRKSKPRLAMNTILMLVLSLAGMSGYYIARTQYAPRVKHFLRSADQSVPSL